MRYLLGHAGIATATATFADMEDRDHGLVLRFRIGGLGPRVTQWGNACQRAAGLLKDYKPCTPKSGRTS